MVFANLRPIKLGPIPQSDGMVLCASTPEKVELMRPPAGCKVGERIQLEGNPCKGGELKQEMLEKFSKKSKVKDQCIPLLKTNGKCEGTFNGCRLMTSKGPVKCKSMKESPIQ